MMKKELGLFLLLAVISALTGAINPAFLSLVNLLNMANLIGLFGVFALGEGLVIITGGIDLSVGSLIALSAVGTAWLIKNNGGASASAMTLGLCCLGAILLCGVVGAFSGFVVTRFAVPPFAVSDKDRPA